MEEEREIGNWLPSLPKQKVLGQLFPDQCFEEHWFAKNGSPG